MLALRILILLIGIWTASGYGAMSYGAIRMLSDAPAEVQPAVREIALMIAVLGLTFSIFGLMEYHRGTNGPRWLIAISFVFAYLALVGVNVTLELSPPALVRMFSTFDRVWIMLLFTVPFWMATLDITQREAHDLEPHGSREAL